MAAPTFVQSVETDWTSGSVTAKTTASFSVLAGDILVACMMTDANVTPGTLTASGGSLTWTQQQDVAPGATARVTLATAVVDTDKSMTATVTRAGGSATQAHGMTVLTFRSASAVGAAAGTSGSGAPSLALTSTQANSAIVVANCDRSGQDGASRVWRTGAGTLTETTYSFSSIQQTFYVGYHADAGAIGTYTLGLTAPTGQTYLIAALEVKGATGRASKNIHSFGLGMQHGQQFGLPAGGRYIG